MQTIVHGIDTPQLPPVAATVGMFDGVHLGHRAVIGFLRRQAAQRGLQSAVLTFDNHPQLLFRPDSDLRLLTPGAAKTRQLATTGVDYTVVFRFDRQLASLSAEEFLQIIRDRYNVRMLVVGFNHHFGRKSSETFADYRRYGERIGVDVVASEELEGDLHVSSSAIRRALNLGDVSTANKMLGRNYAISGLVEGGKRNGRLIGYPTANIALSDELWLVPADGVYAVKVSVAGKAYGGMLNIGTPTVAAGTRRTVEVNIFDFAADIYGEPIAVEFIARVRDERPMDGLNDLKQQLAADKQTIENILKHTINYESH